jgi:hypothetical protein
MKKSSRNKKNKRLKNPADAGFFDLVFLSLKELSDANAGLSGVKESMKWLDMDE